MVYIFQYQNSNLKFLLNPSFRPLFSSQKEQPPADPPLHPPAIQLPSGHQREHPSLRVPPPGEGLRLQELHPQVRLFDPAQGRLDGRAGQLQQAGADLVRQQDREPRDSAGQRLQVALCPEPGRRERARPSDQHQQQGRDAAVQYHGGAVADCVSQEDG